MWGVRFEVIVWVVMAHSTDIHAFNQDLSKWNVSQATDTSWMFYGCQAFNSDLSKWDVSRVKSTSYMFNGARAFNSDLSTWDTSKITEMNWMFRDAQAFNQVVICVVKNNM